MFSPPTLKVVKSFFQDNMPQARTLLGTDQRNGTFEDIIQKMGVQRICKGQSVIEFGDLGHEFFIVMKGKVSIKIPKKQVFQLQKEQKLLKKFDAQKAMNMDEIMAHNMNVLLKKEMSQDDLKIAMLQFCLNHFENIAWKVMDYNHFSENEKPFEKRETWDTKHDESQIENDIKNFINTFGKAHT